MIQEFAGTEPLVSIVIPTYKRPVKYLSRAVESALGQTYTNIEVIVVDDSPADYSGRDEVKRYIESLGDSRLVYKQNEKNMGGSLARNEGVALAHGEYVSFLDDDDEYLPHKLEKQLPFMQDGGYDLTITDLVAYSDKGKVVDYREHSDISHLSQEEVLHYHLMRHLTGTSGFMCRTEKLREIGGFDPAKMGQEFYLMLKAIERGLKIGYLPVCTARYFRHDGEGITQGMNKVNGENALYEVKKKYFSRLSPKEIRFINFRHWAVLVVAYLRNHMYGRMLGAGLRALLASPGDFFAQVTGFFLRVCRNQNAWTRRSY